ncbi:SxtJ family membrane protein [Candidatus Thiothrix sp. Deng01]|uniref:SxtJ family membrane protein n=1 Tax=Candidatus Thiothrix phosphatis TaxID=3112415 RepID=A0ABU6CWM5_9GAMM|nr:SxtJ family membrane protein [Candidatus Thiothrix sp. Deng01]MEB4591185.1 SxtJ family membrane protein [Candidatus Thiothrix sp. Deng01]
MHSPPTKPTPKKAGFLRTAYAAWIKFGDLLGWINTRILLGIAYFLLIVPIGLLMACLKQGHIRALKTADGASLRQPSQPRPPNHVERLF